ncbi:MAG: acyl-CoA thioesterase [Gemmataceae bacterium]
MFTMKRRVEFADTDMAGIMHFANYFRFMEVAEHNFLRDRGLSVFLEWNGETLSFPRVRCTCDYFKPARFQDELTLEVKVDHLGRSSVRYVITVRRGEEILARGETTAVLVRLRPDQTLESVPFPDPIRDKLLGRSESASESTD